MCRRAPRHPRRAVRRHRTTGPAVGRRRRRSRGRRPRTRPRRAGAPSRSADAPTIRRRPRRRGTRPGAGVASSAGCDGRRPARRSRAACRLPWSTSSPGRWCPRRSGASWRTTRWGAARARRRRPRPAAARRSAGRRSAGRTASRSRRRRRPARRSAGRRSPRSPRWARSRRCVAAFAGRSLPMSEVVVITGATAGVGRATVRRFAREGAAIGLIARDREGLEAARKEVENAGGKALVLPVDVADADAVENAAQAAEEALGPIDIWINDAMATVFAWFEDVQPEEFERATRVTYLGAVWGTQAALRRMLPRNHGTIVQVGSALAYRGIPLQSAYCGAKHAMKGFHESRRPDLPHKGTRVPLTMVQLPGLNPPQFEHARAKMPDVPKPVPPVYQPEVAADAIHWAAHHRRREIWVGGPTIKTIMGNRIAPGFAEWYLARTAVKGQQTGQPLGEKVRTGNLFDAPSADHGAHGPFDQGARDRSIQLALSKHRALAGAAAAVGVGAATAVAAAASRRDGRFFR